MKKPAMRTGILLSIFLLAGLTGSLSGQCPVNTETPSLVIQWRHTVCQSENPCPRCLMTPKEFAAAYTRLSAALTELGIMVKLDEQKDTMEDRILFNDDPLEVLLGGKLLKKECSSCGGGEANENKKDKGYNVLEIDGKTYEIIPANLIIRAGLIAASRLFAAGNAAPCGSGSPCSGCQDKSP